MEKATIVALLEKYWQAETTVEEEQALADWFNSQAPGSLDPDLEPYYNLFAYFEEESRVSPGPDLESRILQAVTGAVPAPPAREPATPGKDAPVRHFRWGLIAAAATVLILVAGLFLFQPAKPTVDPNSFDPNATAQTNAVADSKAVAQTNTTAQTTAPITDTYDNPEQALVAVRHALLIASIHLKEGQKQIINK